MTTTSSRLLQLLSLLQARRDWSGSELAGRLEVSGRTIRRDVERLRDLGYPVESVTGPAGGYRLRAGTAMPPLLLDDDEAIAIAVGLRTAARASVTGIEETSVRALVKLEQVLAVAPSPARPGAGLGDDRAHGRRPDRRPAGLDDDRGRVPRPRTPSLLLPQPRGDRQPPRGRAALAREPRAPLVPRRLGPRSREDWRTFRVDRLARLAAIGLRFTPRGLPAPDAAVYVERSITEAQHRYEARVTIHAPADEVAARVPAYWGTVEEKDARSCELRIGDDDLGWLAVRLAMIPVEFEVHEPPELVEHLRALAGRLGRAAGGSR